MITLQRELNRMFRAKPARQPDLHAKARRQFKAVAARHGFTFKVERDGYIECSPCAALPKGLTTAHYDWTETLDRIEACIASPEFVDDKGYYSE
jgi:hypothetical protein